MRKIKGRVLQPGLSRKTANQEVTTGQPGSIELRAGEAFLSEDATKNQIQVRDKDGILRTVTIPDLE